MKAKECDDDNGLKFQGKKFNLEYELEWGTCLYELCPGVKDVGFSP